MDLSLYQHGLKVNEIHTRVKIDFVYDVSIISIPVDTDIATF